MRFYNYLNEKDLDLKYIAQLLYKNCMPYLKDINFSKNFPFLYSGRKKSKIWFKGRVRKDRKPKDTPKEIHNMLDNAFQKKFGIKARSQSLFTSFYINQTTPYGNSYIIFPIGNYEILWNPKIIDLTDKLGNYSYKKFKKGLIQAYYEIEDEKEKAEWFSYIKEIIEKEIVPEYKKGNLKQASKYKSEIMLICNEYYAIYSVLEAELRLIIEEINEIK